MVDGEVLASSGDILAALRVNGMTIDCSDFERWLTSIKGFPLSRSSECNTSESGPSVISSRVGRSTGRGAGGFVIEMTGTGAFDGGSRESSGSCVLGWDGVELVASAKTGIATSAPEL